MIKVDGNKISEEILKGLQKEIKSLKKPLGLGVVLVGKNQISSSFIKKKQEVAEKLGIIFKLFEFDSKISNKQLRHSLGKIAKRSDINGIIIQLPLPTSLNSQYILDAIPFKKDVDVLSSIASGKFYTGKPIVCPPVVEAVLKVFAQYDIKVEAQNVVIVGSGRLVGKPLSLELMRRGATVTVLNKFTSSLAEYVSRADVLISGTGQINLIDQKMIKKGAVVIDAGMSVEATRSGKQVLKGDVSPVGLEKKVKIFVPSSGGLGPITVATLMENLIKLAKA